MSAPTHRPTDSHAGASTPEMTAATTQTGSLADSLATAARAKTDAKPTTSTQQKARRGVEAADELSVPPRLPTPETTLYRDSTTVIRLLQTETMADAVEVRLYRADDTSVETPTAAAMATDRGHAVDGLPAATRERFAAAVEAVADRFDLAVADGGRFRARRPDHGARGVLKFATRLAGQ